MLTRFNQLTVLLILSGCLFVPCIGCGSSTDPVGVDDDGGVEEFEQAQQDPEYIEGEKNL